MITVHLLVYLSWATLYATRCDDFQNETVTETTEEDPSPPTSLPDALQPLDYVVKILPHQEGNSTFDSYVEITLLVEEPTNQIVLHTGNNLTLDDQLVKVTKYESMDKDGRALEVDDIWFYPDSQIRNFTLNESLAVGDTVKFSAFTRGQFVKDDLGINEVDYINKNGIKKRLLATYFQPSGARRVFPCLDEPRFKAKFELSVAIRPGEKALSNMMVNTTFQLKNTNLTWVEFKKSLPMSTYLVGFFISDFPGIELTDSKGRRLKVWAREEMLHRAKYAVEMSVKVLQSCEDYLEVDYPLMKLDFVALPTYPADGMENFGLILSKENSLLTNGQLAQKEWVSNVVAHEVVHQWAGNLVTPKEWTDVWLSEGFATYFAAFILEKIDPSLEAMSNMIVNHVHKVREVDDESNNGLSLLMQESGMFVQNPTYGNIYFKGAQTLRMISSIVGQSSFSEAIKLYMRKFQYQSVSLKDFVDIFEGEGRSNNLTQSLPLPLGSIITTWVEEKYYPLITVKRTTNGSLVARQEVFVNQRSFSNPKPATSVGLPRWWVPLSYATSSNPDFNNTEVKSWIPPSTDWITIDGVNKKDCWVIINVQECVNLRTNYDRETWKEISKLLLKNHTAIHPLNRAHLIDDAFHLFITGYLSADVGLELISYLDQERDYYPFKAALDHMNRFESRLRTNESYPLFMRYLSSIIMPALSDGHAKIKLRNLLTTWACKLDDPNCAKTAYQYFTKWRENLDYSMIPEESIESFFCSAIELGTMNDWDFTYNYTISKSSANNKHKLKIRNALVCTKSTDLIIRYLELIQDPNNGLTRLDILEIFNAISCSSPQWQELLWNYVRANYTKMNFRFKTPVPFVQTYKDFDQLKLLLQERENITEEARDFILRSLEEDVKENTWITDGISEWLKKNSPDFKISSLNIQER